MHIKKSSTSDTQVFPDMRVRLYPLESTNLSFGVAEINGRYPENKRVVNTNFEEMYYIISGSGVVHSEKGDFEVSEGDVYKIDINEKYWVERDNLKIATFCAPPWSEKSHLPVE